jgi:hypothetical protein
MDLLAGLLLFLFYTCVIPFLMQLTMSFSIEPKKKMFLNAILNAIPMLVLLIFNDPLVKSARIELLFGVAFGVAIMSFWYSQAIDEARRIAAIGFQISAALNFAGATLCFLSYDTDVVVNLIAALGIIIIFLVLSAWYLSEIKDLIKE